MDGMNVFQQCWKNWVRHPFGQPDASEHTWINELNQAVFTRLQNILPANVKVRAVTSPAFLYHVGVPGGQGVESIASRVETRRIKLPKDGTFETRVDAAVTQLFEYIRGTGTVFFYTPVVPICAQDFDGGPNRHMMGVRMRVVGETVDVEE